MRVRARQGGGIHDFTNGDSLARGGEGEIHVWPHRVQTVAKLYFAHKPAPVEKLEVMLRNPPADPASMKCRVAWPVDLLETTDGTRKVVGFLMPRAAEERALVNVYNPGIRRKVLPNFTYRYLHRTARNLSAAFRSLHDVGHVIVDVNESNALVSTSALVTVVDADSFQIVDKISNRCYPCLVGKPEFQPPESRDSGVRLDPTYDLFGLSVLIFQLLLEGLHPFSGQWSGGGEAPPIDERITRGLFPYGRQVRHVAPAAFAVPWETVSPLARELFVRCFTDGLRTPGARPSAAEWISALERVEGDLGTCRANKNHEFGAHLSSCPWCRRRDLLGHDPFPSAEAPWPVARVRPPRVAPPKAPAAPRPARPLPPPPQRRPAMGRRLLVGGTAALILALLTVAGRSIWLQSPASMEEAQTPQALQPDSTTPVTREPMPPPVARATAPEPLPSALPDGWADNIIVADIPVIRSESLFVGAADAPASSTVVPIPETQAAVTEQSSATVQPPSAPASRERPEGGAPVPVRVGVNRGDCTVVIDGISIGRTLPTTILMPPGEHRFEFSCPAFAKQWGETITIQGNTQQAQVAIGRVP